MTCLIEKQSGVPMYLQLAEYLIEKIKNNEYAVGDKIPSEAELSRQFHVNRHTVRQAVARVTNLGWISTHKGLGSYVIHRPDTILYKLAGHTNFTHNMQVIGKTHTSRLLHWQRVIPDSYIRQLLQMNEHDYAFQLEILRSIDGTPFSITTSFLPERAVPQLDRHLHDFQSLTGILRSHYHITPVRVRTVLEANVATCKDADLLKMPENTPILWMESVVQTSTGGALELGIARVRGDMSKILVDFL